MHYFAIVFLVVFFTGIAMATNGGETIFGMACDNGVCQREEDKGPCIDDKRPKLFRWEPIRVRPYSLFSLFSFLLP